MKKLLILIVLLTGVSAFALTKYAIEVAHNDELFIIGGEKFEAKTFCLGWEKGDDVIFLRGKPNGVCVSAKLYNLKREKTCNVWCE